MWWFIAAAYLLIGLLLAYVFVWRTEGPATLPLRLLRCAGVMFGWPLVFIFILLGFMGWMRNGSH